jgi:hypothetical protein
VAAGRTPHKGAIPLTAPRVGQDRGGHPVVLLVVSLIGAAVLVVLGGPAALVALPPVLYAVAKLRGD